MRMLHIIDDYPSLAISSSLTAHILCELGGAYVVAALGHEGDVRGQVTSRNQVLDVGPAGGGLRSRGV